MPTASRLQVGLAVVLAMAAFALLASAFLIGATPDEEEFRFTVLTSWLHVWSLAEGRYSFWTSLLGFGLPQPFIANYWMHPLLPLLGVMTPIAWMRLVLLVHTALGAWGMWRLIRLSGVRPIVAALCVATFLLAAPSQNYVLVDFWPSVWMSLTIMPWVLMGAWRLLHGPERQLWGWAAALGLLAGLVVATTNPGSIVIYGVFVPALLATSWREAWQRRRYVAAAGVLAALLTAPNAVLLAEEGARFDPAFESTRTAPLPASSAWDVFMRPLSASGSPWQDDVVARGTRLLFFGGPFAVLALVALASGGWQRRDLAIAALLALLPLFLAAVPAVGASDRYLFRDVVVLTAIPLAGLAAERGLAGPAMRWPTGALLVTQGVVVVLAAWPFLVSAWEEGRDGARTYHGAVGNAAGADRLAALIGPPGRLLLSPQVDYEMRERGLLSAGIGVNALAYRGIPVINGWFKGVSADPVWPDERLYYARLRTPPPLVEAAATLDALGIQYVLARPDEAVAADLSVLERIPTPRDELVLYRNEDAWPGAFVLRESLLYAALPVLPRCDIDRLLCRDLAVLEQAADLGGVVVRRGEGTIDVAMPPRELPSVLVVSEMFRPAWQASASGERLEPLRFAGSLLAVRVPAGAAAVRFTYRPWPLITATGAAFTAVLAGLVTILVAAARRGRRVP